MSLGYRPAAIVKREPTCVRFGPVMPTEFGLPLMVWQPMHAEIEYTFCPRPASPTSPGVKVRPSGVGVVGML